MSRVVGLILAVCLAFGGAGCTGCATALLEGALVADGAGGMAVKAAQGAVIPVDWPDGIHVGTDGDDVVLTDLLGAVVAREGEFVRLGGGSALEGPGFAACGPISVTSPTPETQ